MDRWSRLTSALAPILDRVAPGPLSEEDRDLVEVLVADYGLDGPDAPAWMVDVLEEIAHGHVGRPRRGVPDENKLSCVLEEIQDELFPLGLDDCGEDMTWLLPAFGVRLVVIRETSGPGPLVYLKRLNVRRTKRFA